MRGLSKIRNSIINENTNNLTEIMQYMSFNEQSTEIKIVLKYNNAQ